MGLNFATGGTRFTLKLCTFDVAVHESGMAQNRLASRADECPFETGKLVLV
jgi:hypothetical protein